MRQTKINRSSPRAHFTPRTSYSRLEPRKSEVFGQIPIERNQSTSDDLSDGENHSPNTFSEANQSKTFLRLNRKPVDSDINSSFETNHDPWKPIYMHRLNASSNGESGSSSQRRFQSTMNGQWNPIGFAVNEFYDFETGRAKDYNTCLEGIQKLIRNKRKVNFYECVQLAEECRRHDLPEQVELLCLGEAFQVATKNVEDNSAEKKQQLEEHTAVIPKRGFSLDRALQLNARIDLPNGTWCMIGDLLNPNDCGNWTSTHFESHLTHMLIKRLDKLAEHDPDFSSYGASDRANTYVPIGDAFYSGIVDFSIVAFGQEETFDMRTYVKLIVTKTLSNKLNRLRLAQKDQDDTEGSGEKVENLKRRIMIGVESRPIFPARRAQLERTRSHSGNM